MNDATRLAVFMETELLAARVAGVVSALNNSMPACRRCSWEMKRRPALDLRELAAVELLAARGHDEATEEAVAVHVERELPDLFTVAPFSDFETSLEAAKAIEPHLQRLEALVLVEIRAAGDRGACCHEIEAATGLPHTTASARIRGLVLKGMVEGSEIRRRTPAGRNAKAWRLKAWTA